MLHVYGEVFQRTDVVFGQLQRNNLDIGYSTSAFGKPTSFWNSWTPMRISLGYWKSLMSDDVQKSCPQPNENREFRRDSAHEERRELFDGILKILAAQLRSRFNDLEKVPFVEPGDSSRFNEYVQCFHGKAIIWLLSTYPGRFDISRLKNELRVMYGNDEWRSKPMHTIIRELVACGRRKEESTFAQAFNLFVLIATTPSSSAVQRSFSCLNRVKTALRNTMSNDRLEELMRISMERKTIHAYHLAYDKLTARFASTKTRRIDCCSGNRGLSNASEIWYLVINI